MDAISQTRIGAIYPELARRWTQADQMLTSLGFDIRIDQGWRSVADQDALYAQGRTTPGEIVTYAQGLESYHCMGLAIDFVPMENGEPVWDRTHPAYAKTIQIAESLGLTSGSTWPEPKTDFPHLQITGRFPVDAPDSYCQQLFTSGGLQAVWHEVDLALGLVPTNASDVAEAAEGD